MLFIAIISNLYAFYLKERIYKEPSGFLFTFWNKNRKTQIGFQRSHKKALSFFSLSLGDTVITPKATE